MITGNRCASGSYLFKALPTKKNSIHNALKKFSTVSVFAVTLSLTTAVSAQDDSGAPLDPNAVRNFIAGQVVQSGQENGLVNLMVPATDADIPQPLLPDGTVDPFFANSPERRFLGQQLFFDPIRTTNIMPEFGAVPETAQEASCGSCHVPEAAGKAGTLLNFSLGGEGKGFTDADGNFILRRRTQSDPSLFPLLRSEPLFEGDTLVDQVPTLTEIFEGDELVASGMFDAIDSVPRVAPNLVGYAFNNRLLLGGLAGNPGPDNPNNFTAGNNLTELTINVHRMFDTQSAVLQEIPVYVQLFKEAFPDEAVEAEAQDNLDLLINDDTVTRAMAAFLRTVVTRNTPWDKFLAGDNEALTPAQLNGANLFFTPAANGLGGAGCFSCHSGPMLNKQPNDPDVTGMGNFVEENFFNLGLGDHPLQALNADALGDLDFRDRGRMNDTGEPDDEFELRTVTLRQVKVAGQLMHSGEFTEIRDVVEYFNEGVALDVEAGESPTFTDRFAFPRGQGFPRGLGLSDSQMDDLTDFIDNGLFDPALQELDRSSTTKTLGPNDEIELNYSVFRPDLAALGAVDGFVASGLPAFNNDALSRRDFGLEFLDVTDSVSDTNLGNLTFNGQQLVLLSLNNTSEAVVDTHLLLVVNDLPEGVTLLNRSGTTSDGNPFIRIFLTDGVLDPGGTVLKSLIFDGVESESRGAFFFRANPVDFSVTLLSGQGTP